MLKHTLSQMSLAILCLVVLIPAVAAQTPSEPLQKLVTYRIYDDPNDPNASLAYEVILLLEERGRSGDTVDWSAEEVEIRKKAPDGGPDTVWVDASPSFDTVSRNWQIFHDDADNPTNEEFALPPLISGVASQELLATDDLEYSIEGVTYTPPLEGAHWEDTTAALDYEFVIEGETTPLDEGTDEPTELPPIINPPEGT